MMPLAVFGTVTGLIITTTVLLASRGNPWEAPGVGGVFVFGLSLLIMGATASAIAALTWAIS